VVDCGWRDEVVHADAVASFMLAVEEIGTELLQAGEQEVTDTTDDS
jgi:hypothetical protein